MKVIVGVFLGLVLIGTIAVNAQLSRGTIENALNDPENINCEYISIQEGIDTPMRFAMNFPTSSNVTPDISASDPNTQFSSDFNNEGFFFSTNSTDLFTIRLDIDYEFANNNARNIFYEFFVEDNILKQTGNWQEYSPHFCKIIEFFAKPAPHIMSDQEIIETIAGFEKEQHEATHKKIDLTNDFIAMIAMTVVAIGIIAFIWLVLQKMSRSKDITRTIKQAKLLQQAIDDLKIVSRFVIRQDDWRRINYDYVIDRIEGLIKAYMIHTTKDKEFFEKYKFSKPPRATYMEDTTEEIQRKEDESLGFFDKMISKVKKNIPVDFVKEEPKEKTEQTAKEPQKKELQELNEMTVEEIMKEIDKMFKKLEKDEDLYSKDEKFRNRYDSLQAEYSKRMETK